MFLQSKENQLFEASICQKNKGIQRNTVESKEGKEQGI